MAWGFVRSGVTASSPSSPHPVLSNFLCLLIIIIVSPISAVTYHDHQQSDGGVAAAAAAAEINNIPSDLMDLSCCSSGSPRGQQPAGDVEQESPPAEQGRAISPPSPSSVQAEGSGGQWDSCQYEVRIRTSCSSPPLVANQNRKIKISFGAKGDLWVHQTTYQTRVDFLPCTVKWLSFTDLCAGRICLVRIEYEGRDGEWKPNYVKVSVTGQMMETFCIPPLINGKNENNRCSSAAALPAATTAPARTDDEFYTSCGSAAAVVETANIRPWISN